MTTERERCAVCAYNIVLTLETEMDHQTAKEILRLSRLSERAQAYQQRAREKRDVGRLFRAVRLEEAAESKMIAITTGEVETYSSVA